MAGYLDAVREQLVERTEHGPPQPGRRPSPRRPRRAAGVLAGAAALLIAAAVVAIALSAGSHPRRLAGAHHRPQPSHRAQTPRTHRSAPAPAPHRATPPPRTAVSQPPAGPVPSGFAPESFTAIGASTWWLLGSAPCSSPPCTSIVRTDDGGRTFVGIPAPRTRAVSQLRFANADDGFAYGPQLWVTHDQGRSWHRVALPGALSDLATSGGYVYAIVTTPGGVGRLMRSPVNRDSWSSLPAAGDAYTGLWAQGSTVLLESASKAAQSLLISHDYGQTFASQPVPASVACAFQEPQPPVVWAHCATGMLSGTWISTDGGARFREASRAPSGQEPLPNSAAFAAASATTAVVGYRQLYRTTDGGASWTPVPTPSGISWWRYLGFTDPTHGVALGYVGAATAANERLYYTVDGGRSYHPVTIR